MCKTWGGSRRVAAYQGDSNLRSLSKPLAQSSVIELKFSRMLCVILTMMWK